MSDHSFISQAVTYFKALQDTLCARFETEENSCIFEEDIWEHQAGKGGGRVRLMQNGTVFEKAGINFSHVIGDALPVSATASRPELAGRHFQAAGISVIMHPRNPYVPISHANVRFFIAEKSNSAPIWWFGGGYDMTPIYGFKEDCVHWHKTAKSTCDAFDKQRYFQYKKWCDNYFVLPHRQEQRGIGGLFFDDLNTPSFETCFAFVQSIGYSYGDAYQPIVARRKHYKFSKQQKEFQLYRRGRYVEFNLLHDRGTLFGLQSGGRTESILMSLPPEVHWKYNWHPAPHSEEENLYKYYLKVQDWV